MGALKRAGPPTLATLVLAFGQDLQQRWHGADPPFARQAAPNAQRAPAIARAPPERGCFGLQADQPVLGADLNRTPSAWDACVPTPKAASNRHQAVIVATRCGTSSACPSSSLGRRPQLAIGVVTSTASDGTTLGPTPRTTKRRKAGGRRGGGGTRGLQHLMFSRGPPPPPSDARKSLLGVAHLSHTLPQRFQAQALMGRR